VQTGLVTAGTIIGSRTGTTLHVSGSGIVGLTRCFLMLYDDAGHSEVIYAEHATPPDTGLIVVRGQGGSAPRADIEAGWHVALASIKTEKVPSIPRPLSAPVLAGFVGPPGPVGPEGPTGEDPNALHWRGQWVP
jgi:hypothetical protein